MEPCSRVDEWASFFTEVATFDCARVQRPFSTHCGRSTWILQLVCTNVWNGWKADISRFLKQIKTSLLSVER